MSYKTFKLSENLACIMTTSIITTTHTSIVKIGL